jgi:hypothetical protein
MLMRTPHRWVRPKRLQPPGFIVPCQPTLADKVPAGDGWIHELKHDGFRVLASEYRCRSGPPTTSSTKRTGEEQSSSFRLSGRALSLVGQRIGRPVAATRLAAPALSNVNLFTATLEQPRPREVAAS